MKKTVFLSVAMMLLAAVALSGCPKRARLDVNPKTLHIDPAKQFETEVVRVENTGRGRSLEFTFTTTEDWVTVETLVGEDFTLAPGESTEIFVTLTDPDKQAFQTAELQIRAGNAGGEDVEITTAPDFHAERFTTSNDLANTQITFVPNGSPSFYERIVTAAPTAFETPTDGLVPLIFADDTPLEQSTPAGVQVPFYGVNYDSLFVSPRGFVSFGEPGEGNENLQDHFAVPQVSGIAVDAVGNGDVTVQHVEDDIATLQDDERIVVTYQNVPSSDTAKQGNTNSFQFEFFTNGDLRMTFLGIDSSIGGVSGLSNGFGAIPDGFLETDLNTGNLN